MQLSGPLLAARQTDRQTEWVGEWKKLRGNRMFQYPKLQRGETETRRTEGPLTLGLQEEEEGDSLSGGGVGGIEWRKSIRVEGAFNGQWGREGRKKSQ